MSQDSNNTEVLGGIEQDKPVRVALDAFRPERLLRALRQSPGAIRITARGPEGKIRVDVQNGVVMGAQSSGVARRDGQTGPAALKTFLGMRQGTAEVAVTRFLRLANIFRPVERILDGGADTGVARVHPSVPPPVTEVPRQKLPDRAVYVGRFAGGPALSNASRPAARTAPPATRRVPDWVWTLMAACALAFFVGAVAGLLWPPPP